jgi:hypothetical protein
MKIPGVKRSGIRIIAEFCRIRAGFPNQAATATANATATATTTTNVNVNATTLATTTKVKGDVWVTWQLLAAAGEDSWWRWISSSLSADFFNSRFLLA